jgi:L-methionine (R)-S-oxide reductase
MWMMNSKYGEETFFSSLESELNALIYNEKNLTANLANIASWIYHCYPNLNWCGFYLWDEADQELILGPFQGKPACLRIKSGRGVCGTSFQRKSVLKIDNVHEIENHIACDSASVSELVIPLIKGETIFGVLDLDSPLPSRFTQNEAEELTKIMNNLSQKIF